MTAQSHLNYGPRPTRGNSYDRRARKQYLLRKFGDGETVLCYRCRIRLHYSSLTVDRIKPGIEGGTYCRDNIRPACRPCNCSTGAALAVLRRERNAA